MATAAAGWPSTAAPAPRETIWPFLTDGAKHVAMSQFDPENKELAKVRDLPVVIYCRTGQTSAEACKRLKKAGFSKVFWLDGGLSAWLTAELPVVKGAK